MMMMLIMPNSFVDQPFGPLDFVNLLAVDDDDADVAEFPCCVLSYFSLVFVMEHSCQIEK